MRFFHFWCIQELQFMVLSKSLPLFISWIIFLLHLGLYFIGTLLVFRWELIVLLLLQICFLSVMKEISWSLSHGKNQADIIEAFNSTLRYLDDLSNNDNIYFDQMDRIYPTELQLNKANSSATKAPFLNLNQQFPPKIFMINGTILILI